MGGGGRASPVSSGFGYREQISLQAPVVSREFCEAADAGARVTHGDAGAETRAGAKTPGEATSPPTMHCSSGDRFFFFFRAQFIKRVLSTAAPLCAVAIRRKTLLTERPLPSPRLWALFHTVPLGE